MILMGIIFGWWKKFAVLELDCEMKGRNMGANRINITLPFLNKYEQD
jgi:hypothetical protein